MRCPNPTWAHRLLREGAGLYLLAVRLFMLVSESSPCLLHSCRSWYMQLQLEERGENCLGEHCCCPGQCCRAGALLGCPPSPAPTPPRMLQGLKQLQTSHSITRTSLSHQALTASLTWQRQGLEEEDLDQKLTKPGQKLFQHVIAQLPAEEMRLVWPSLGTSWLQGSPEQGEHSLASLIDFVEQRSELQQELEGTVDILGEILLPTRPRAQLRASSSLPLPLSPHHFVCQRKAVDSQDHFLAQPSPAQCC